MPTKTSIAVIGLSARYAGGVHTPEQLWAHLMAGVDPIADFPTGRWDRGYLSPDHATKGRSYIYAGGYLDDVAGFDAEFFGISPREAQQIDPQQRLLLELAWEALEDAGIVPERVAGSRTGVFVGLSNRDYGDFHEEGSIDAYTNLGLALSIASNRVSYILDLKGPSFTVDTACSSGMVALHQAMQSLVRGECEMALAGAANLLLSPKAFIGFAKASMLSPAGRCTTFDANGAGYVRAEGGGVLVLKRLEDAERDGDPILGVIVGSGVNSDGRTMGIALPSGEAQAALLRQVYAEAGVAPDDVYYVEAHGTGTAVGDPIECGAIASVLGGDRRGAEPLRVGSIKSNVGHLEPAAGIAGITKVLLALKHRQLPANLHFKTPNPKIDFEGWKLDVVSTHRPLPLREKPLAFGVNSFGFGGTNAHAVIQEYRPSASVQARHAVPAAATPPAAAKATPWRDLLVISGQTPAALQSTAQRWLTLLTTDMNGSTPDTAARWETLRANALHHRTHHAHRLAVHAGNAEDAVERLSAYLAGQASAEAAFGKATTTATGRARVAWVYAGNGPQWWGMGRQLMAADSTYRSAVEAVDQIFSQLAGWSLIDELMRDEATTRMALTEVAQPTLFALQVGLTTVLRAAGLPADAVIGHSVGEAAAAWASGALSLQQATHVIHQRSLAQSATAGMGRMAALGVSEAEARAAIAEVGGFLEVAAVNSAAAVTVAGDPAQLATLCQRLVDAGKFARVLALDYPFHTQAMDGIRDGLLEGLDGLAPGDTERDFVSTVEGRVLPGRALGADYWWRNIRQPVAFAAGVTHLMQELKVSAFIEIGPHPVLRDYLLQSAKALGVPAQVLTTLRRPRGDAAEPELGLLRQTVCTAYAQGLGDPTQLCAPPAQRVALPLVAWQRQRHWRGAMALPDQHPATEREHPLLGFRASAAAAVWDHHLDPTLLHYLADHVIQDAAIFPGAGYLELALAAGRSLLGDSALQLEDIDFLKPLVLAGSSWPWVQCSVDAADGTFAITSRAEVETGDNSTLHARGRLTRAEAAHRPPAIDTSACWALPGVPVSAQAHIAGAVARGMHYGPAFQGVTDIRLAEDEPMPLARAWISLPTAAGLAAAGTAADTLAGYRSHPVLLDACLQVLITLMGHLDTQQRAYIPVRVDRLRSFAPLPQRLFCEVHLLRDSPRSGCARFTLRDETGACVMVLDNTRFQKVDFQASRATPHLADRWRPASSAQGVDIQLPSPAALLPSLRTAAAAESTGPDTAETRLEALAGAYAAHALQVLQHTAGLSAATFTAAALQRRARIVPGQVPLFRALVDMALAEGWLQASETGLTWAHRTAADPAILWQATLMQHPGLAAELMLLAQVGERLPELLRGEAEPALPAGERAHPAFETLFESAPTCATAQALTARVMSDLAAARPAGRALRVLELHAAATGTSATVLAALPGTGVDYAASERDPQALERLLRRLGSHGALRGLVLDLADDQQQQPLAAAFDVVLCADGLQGAPLPFAESLRRAVALLSPGGWLVLVAPRPQRLATLVMGQNPEWWQADQAPAQDAAAWLQALADAGCDGALALPAGAMSLLVAQKPEPAGPAEDPAATAPNAAAESPRRWLLLTDGSAAETHFAPHLAAALNQRGQQVSTLALAADEDAAAMSARISAVLPQPHTVVHLAGLTAPASADPMLQQSLRCLPLIALAQTQQPSEGLPTWVGEVVLVTHNANPGPGTGVNVNPAQATAWGLARVLANEHPGLKPRLVDLQGPLASGTPAAQGPASLTTLAQRLADELLAAEGETEVLLDSTGRWLHRLEVAAPTATPGMSCAATAVRLSTSAQGGLEGLQLLPVNRQPPAAGEVELEVRAAGLNFRDVLWAMNMLPEEAVEDGFSGATIGMECAGVVVAVGVGVDDLAVGDRVIGFASGCFASHVTTAAGAVARIPAGLSFAEAATVPTAFLTAQYALVHLARLGPGERVLIHGAAGGVGLAAVQIAKLRGAVVFGTAGTVEKRRLLRLVGVDHVLDSRSLAFADDVMAITGGEGIDVVLNSLAGEAITKNLQILRPFGRLLEIGKRDYYANTRIGLRPFRINLSYFGIDADTLLIERPALARKVFAEVAAELAAGRLRPLPFQALPISRASRAFRLMQQSRHVGKIVVTLPPAGTPLPVAQPQRWRADAHGTFLVTGGLGGFGLATAQWLVAQGARHLALVSRRGASTAEAQAGIALLQAAGATVKAYAADMGLADEVARVLTELRATQPPLRGVVHAAMVLDDAPLHALNRERLVRVLQPKLGGAWHLHQQTRQDALQCFVLYSSATITIGNPGQGSYVAANQALHALAELRHAQGLPGLSVAWGAIADVGVVTRTEGLAAMLEKRSGMVAIPATQALAELGRALAAGAVAVTVAPLDLQRLATLLPVARAPRMAALAPAHEGAGDGVKSHETLAERWPRTVADARRPLVLDVLREQLARILGTAATQVDVERPLSDMGLDSLMAVELATSLEREVGRPVSVMKMIQAASAAAVADTLLASLEATTHG